MTPAPQHKEQEFLPCRSKRSMAHTTHGHTSREMMGAKYSPTYQSWISMRTRCRLSGRDNADRYKDKGITYCDRWESFDNFLADMGERPNGTSLDRINGSGNYEPTNCRWATPREQARNTRKNKLTFNAAVQVAVMRLEGVTCKEISELYGISESLPREIVKGRTWPDALAEAKLIVESKNG